MDKPHIRYRSGYKYQLVESHELIVGVTPTVDVETDYIDLAATGFLLIKKGYAWDGPSGPAIDTKNFMRGSLVHDALYQLIRHEHIGANWRAQADLELKRICREDGMSRLRAWWVHRGVQWLGKPSVMPEARKKVKTAP